MKKDIQSFYGENSLLKKYCHSCKQYSFIEDDEFICCGKPITKKKTKIIIKQEVSFTKKNYRKRIPEKIKKEFFKSGKAECTYCGCDLTLENIQFDHFIPFCFNKSNFHKNRVPICGLCNRIKSDNIFNTIEEAKNYIAKRKKILMRERMIHKLPMKINEQSHLKNNY